MGREIKFRQFCSAEDHVDYGMHYMKFNGILVRDGDWHIMQYTGLKDKNGVEIYEGDIARVGDKGVTSVTFFDGAFYTVVSHSNYRCGGWETKSIEIIGNIYENPELLETTQ